MVDYTKFLGDEKTIITVYGTNLARVVKEVGINVGWFKSSRFENWFEQLN